MAMAVLSWLPLLLLLLLLLQSSVSLVRADGDTFPDEEQEADFKNWIAHIFKTSDSAKWSDPDLEKKFPSLSSVTSDSSQPANIGDGSWKRHQRAERHPKTVVVSKDGKGDYKTVAEAVEAVPSKNARRYIIHIKEGVYWEKFDIPKSKPYITFLGDGQDKTIISYNATASTDGPGDLPLRTYHSATVGVSSQYFIAKHLTFRNTAPAPNPGDIGKQAVAFRISADRAAFYHVSFLGTQDTLYDQRGRHYFKNCYIQGSIDFIFGYGRSLYKNCHLHSIAKTFGSLTAQKRNATLLDTGFSFVDSSVTGTGYVYLGRAWGTHSRVVFAYTYFDDIIVPDGWQDWGIPAREKTVFYGEYKSYGPGANSSLRVKWARKLTAEEVKPFLTVGFINGKGWLESF